MAPDLQDIWQAGVSAVKGAAAVERWLQQSTSEPPTHIIAVGKAACDMALPALRAFPDAQATIVTKHGHSIDLPGDPHIYEAGHPIPDTASLVAGSALLHAVQDCGAGARLLLLVSGGASAVAESLPDGMGLLDWQDQTQALMASGADIHEINTHRKTVSQIKGGKLLSQFQGASVTTLAISDVEGDSLDIIGSGIGAAPARYDFAFEAHIIASNAIARKACAQACAAMPVRNDECLYEEVETLAPRLGQTLRDGPKGIYIFGGEPTVILPDKPGRGGRNQALALALAREISGLEGYDILVAGTDGSDGPTGDAGGRVTGQTWQAGAAEALQRADAGSYLADKGALVTTGPTGTNVMDLVIARKS